MESKNFIIANCRFHLFDQNKFIFTGFYPDDNPDQRTIKVFVDDKEQDVEYVYKKGIEIRQKYLSMRMNVSEEIIGSFSIEGKWEDVQRLSILCYYNNDVHKSMEFSHKQLMQMRNEIYGYIENTAFSEGKITVTGWAAASEEVQLQIYKNGTEIPCEITRGYRKDVKASVDELSNEYQPGYKIVIEAESFKGLVLQLTTGEKKQRYKLRAQKSVSTDGIIDKVLFYLKHYGVKRTTEKVFAVLTGNDVIKKRTKENEYKYWLKKYNITQEELEKQRETTFDYCPKFSIVIPLYNTNHKYLRELLDSIEAQTYTNWELCLADGSGAATSLKAIIEKYAQKNPNKILYKILTENKGISENTNAALSMASGDYIVLADHDDIVPANALFECAKVLNDDNTIDVIYSDEDKIDMDGEKYFEPHFKSDFNIDLLCSMNYICHLFVVKKTIIDHVGMFRSEFDGAQDHDFILRCCEVAKNIKHIPKILYHWRCHMDSTAANPESKLYAFEAGRKAVEEHYKRIGIPATVEHAQFYGMFHTKYHWEEQPLVSIIIPNKDHSEDLKKIMDSIDEKSTYRNYEFVIVENNSTEDETFAFYKSIENRENVQVLYYDGIFNYSRINNFGVKRAKGEYLLLLNNDTELISPEGLEEMLHICMREEVGIVGAKLCYEDDTIQHAGVVLGFGGIAGHAFIESSRYDSGYFSRIICVQDYSAVTAACLMTKRSVYEAVSGLTEEFQVAFNDIDYCMKVRKLGKLVVYTPYAELYHYESKSRGLEDTPEKVERFNSEVARFIDRWNKELQEGDPYYNTNLTLDKADFSLKE